MDQHLNDLVALLVPAIGAVMTALLGYATAWLREKAKSEVARTVIALASDAVDDVQAEVQHTVVERLKRGGLWDKNAAAGVRKDAIDAIRRNLGAANMRRLNEVLSGAADEWLETRLEATVARRKTP